METPNDQQPRLSVILDEEEDFVPDDDGSDDDAPAMDAQELDEATAAEVGLTEDTEMEEPSKLAVPEPVEEVEEVQTVTFEVRTPSGKKYMMNDVHLETTIREVKEMIHKRDDSYPVAIIKLIKTGKVLSSPAQTIREAGIKEGSILHMVKKLTGGVVKNDAHGVGIEEKRTQASERGFLTIRIPPNAREGTRLILNPPGRSDRLFVTVPRGHRPGDTLRVRLPEERGVEGSNVNRNFQAAPPPPNMQTQRTNRQPNPQPSNIQQSELMKVKCPANVSPGTDIQIEVPGRGRMKVKVPNSIRPGEYFYFRVHKP